MLCYGVQRYRFRSAIPPRPTEHRWHRLVDEVDDSFSPTQTNERQSGARPSFGRSVPFCASSCPRARGSHGTLGDGACLRPTTVPICLRALHEMLGRVISADDTISALHHMRAQSARYSKPIGINIPTRSC